MLIVVEGKGKTYSQLRHCDSFRGILLQNPPKEVHESRVFAFRNRRLLIHDGFVHLHHTFTIERYAAVLEAVQAHSHGPDVDWSTLYLGVFPAELWRQESRGSSRFCGSHDSGLLEHLRDTKIDNL